ncbi:MAG: Gfo/Idh/MocA family oxidoreductase [Lentisphaeria bacterium]|nr:Gfo/Idh/MocA family oxidoreductase [Lentisphaeria bacterium]
MDKKIKVAVLGTGGRSRCVMTNLLNDSDYNVEIVSVYDPDMELAARMTEEWKYPLAQVCSSFEEAIHVPGVEWVMVFSPNAYHKEQILAAFAAGKHVFSEKPLATSISDCQEIYEAHQKTDVIFATGFVLRYSKVYQTAKEILASGKLGRILSINADENIIPEHGGYIMCNWRRDSRISGPHILEKCCHDLDLINWFCESLPSRVSSFGSLDFFVPENEHLMQKYGKETFCKWYDPHPEPSPFTSEKDLMDKQVSILQYRNGILVNFQCTMSNTIPERRMYFTCTEGTLILELYKSTVHYMKMGDPCMYSYNFYADGHGGGDNYIMKELYRTMCDKTPPRCSGNEGLESAVVALAIDQAAQKGEVIDLEEVWKKLER